MSKKSEYKREMLKNHLHDLNASRKNWEQGSYKASRDELYELLGSCLDIYRMCKGNRTLIKALKNFVGEQGIYCREDAGLATWIVRAVFLDPNSSGSVDPKWRLHGYQRVIVIAEEKGLKGNELPKFLWDNRGIDEVRREASKNIDTLTKVELIDYADRTLHSTETGDLVTRFSLPAALEPADTQSFSLALVRKNADQTGSIVHGIRNVNLVRSALAFVGKKLHQQDNDQNAQRIREEAEAEEHSASIEFSSALAQARLRIEEPDEDIRHSSEECLETDPA